MSFFNIIPKNNNYLDYNVKSIPLNVVRNGIDYTPDIKIKTVDLNRGQKNFVNVSGDGDKFKIKIILNVNDTVKGEADNKTVNLSLIEVLDYYIRTMTVFLVTCDDAVDIANGEYLITGNSKRQQNYRDGYTIWDLEFTKYTGVPTLFYNWDNTYSESAVATYLANKQKTSNANKVTTNTTASKLKNCDTNKLKYSATKTNYDCVKWLQEILKKMGYYTGAVDGWYGSYTVEAVKKFQKAYKKKNLLVDGWCGPVTLACIIESAG